MESEAMSDAFMPLDVDGASVSSYQTQQTLRSSVARSAGHQNRQFHSSHSNGSEDEILAAATIEGLRELQRRLSSAASTHSVTVSRQQVERVRDNTDVYTQLLQSRLVTATASGTAAGQDQIASSSTVHFSSHQSSDEKRQNSFSRPSMSRLVVSAEPERDSVASIEHARANGSAQSPHTSNRAMPAPSSMDLIGSSNSNSNYRQNQPSSSHHKPHVAMPRALVSASAPSHPQPRALSSMSRASSTSSIFRLTDRQKQKLDEYGRRLRSELASIEQQQLQEMQQRQQQQGGGVSQQQRARKQQHHSADSRDQRRSRKKSKKTVSVAQPFGDEDGGVVEKLSRHNLQQHQQQLAEAEEPLQARLAALRERVLQRTGGGSAEAAAGNVPNTGQPSAPSRPPFKSSTRPTTADAAMHKVLRKTTGGPTLSTVGQRNNLTSQHHHHHSANLSAAVLRDHMQRNKLPFVSAAATGKSHSIKVNLQQLLATLKNENPLLHQVCLRVGHQHNGGSTEDLADAFRHEIQTQLDKLEEQLGKDLRLYDALQAQLDRPDGVGDRMAVLKDVDDAVSRIEIVDTKMQRLRQQLHKLQLMDADSTTMQLLHQQQPQQQSAGGCGSHLSACKQRRQQLLGALRHIQTERLVSKVSAPTISSLQRHRLLCDGDENKVDGGKQVVCAGGKSYHHPSGAGHQRSDSLRQVQQLRDLLTQ